MKLFKNSCKVSGRNRRNSCNIHRVFTIGNFIGLAFRLYHGCSTHFMIGFTYIRVREMTSLHGSIDFKNIYNFIGQNCYLCWVTSLEVNDSAAEVTYIGEHMHRRNNFYDTFYLYIIFKRK